MSEDPTADRRARQLLAGPRGRRLCAELLIRADGDPGAPTGWSAAPARGRALRDLLDALARTDLRDAAQPSRLDIALQASVDRARYWQEPDEVDLVLADDDLAAHLLPVAAAVAEVPASRWWTEPMAAAVQHAVAWPRAPGDQPDPPRTSGARAALEAWREGELAGEARAARERPADPRAAWSGNWWSTPADAGLVVTARSRAQDPGGAVGIRVPVEEPVGLLLVEDEMGWPSARTWHVHPPTSARIFELTGPESWTALVAHHPLVLTASRRHDWWRATGWPGAWVIPDWLAVADRFDAVHLTVDGYLSTAGRALPVAVPGPPARTLLGGWNPDATWWLADVLPEAPGEHRLATAGRRAAPLGARRVNHRGSAGGGTSGTGTRRAA